MAQDEARSRRPRVRAPAPPPPQILQMPAVDDLKGEPELGLKLVAPLRGHRRGREHQREIDPAAQQQLAQHQSRLHRLAQPHVVGDQQVHAREAQGLAQRQQLIGVEADAGAERRLEQIPLRRGGGAPLHRAQIGGKGARIVAAVQPQRRPRLLVAQPRVDLGAPQHARRLAAGIIVDAGEAMAVERRFRLALDQPEPPAQRDELADGGVRRWHADAVSRGFAWTFARPAIPFRRLHAHPSRPPLCPRVMGVRPAAAVQTVLEPFLRSVPDEKSCCRYVRF